MIVGLLLVHMRHAMKKSLCLVFCACVAVSNQLVSLTAHKRHHGNKIIYPDEYLNHLGYMDNSHSYWLHTRAERKKSIKLYQTYYGLKVSGRIDKQTWKLMTTPRCGVPDFGKGTLPVPFDSKSAKRRQKRHTYKGNTRAVNLPDARYTKWIAHHVSWKPGKLTPNLPWRQQRSVFDTAFRKWSAPSKLKLYNTNHKADIEVNFARREHGDGAGNAFDGRGMMLAHAFGPGNVDISGDIHFDADEDWSYGRDSTKTRDLLMVAMHEVGHSLGLSHTNDSLDVMYPVYFKYNPDPKLSRGDVRQLRKLYGKDRTFKLPPNLKRLRKRKYRVDRSKPKWCRRAFNDVVRGPYREGYAFVGKYIYGMDAKGLLPGYPKLVRDVFPRAPKNARAVIYVREKMQTYFFKGKRLWRYTDKTLDPGYPMKTKNVFPEKVEFGLAMLDSKGNSIVFLFGQTLTWRWNQFTEEVNGRYHSIGTYWGGLPKYLDAAVEWFDGSIYFFYRAKYYKVQKHRKVVMSGYPRFKGPAWFGGQCGSFPK